MSSFLMDKRGSISNSSVVIEIAPNSPKITNMRKVRFTDSRGMIRHRHIMKGSKLYWRSSFGRLMHKARAEWKKDLLKIMRREGITCTYRLAGNSKVQTCKLKLKTLKTLNLQLATTSSYSDEDTGISQQFVSTHVLYTLLQTANFAVRSFTCN